MAKSIKLKDNTFWDGTIFDYHESSDGHQRVARFTNGVMIIWGIYSNVTISNVTSQLGGFYGGVYSDITFDTPFKATPFATCNFIPTGSYLMYAGGKVSTTKIAQPIFIRADNTNNIVGTIVMLAVGRWK